jgi:hypothetical protein
VVNIGALVDASGGEGADIDIGAGGSVVVDAEVDANRMGEEERAVRWISSRRPPSR